MNCHSHELTRLKMASFLLVTSGPKFKLSKYMIFFPLMSMTIKYQCVFMLFSRSKSMWHIWKTVIEIRLMAKQFWTCMHQFWYHTFVQDDMLPTYRFPNQKNLNNISNCFSVLDNTNCYPTHKFLWLESFILLTYYIELGEGGEGSPTKVGLVCRGVQLTMITDCQKTTYSVWGLPY